MKVLLVGSGGREHALAWQLAQSDNCDALYCAPGNAGIAECAQCVDIGVDEIDALTHFAKDNDIDLVLVGPENPLVDGLADAMRDAGIKTFGPSKKAAQLEGSKAFMKDLCARHGVPTAAYGRFTDYDTAASFIDDHGAPIVIKTDGLAAGKGVIIAQTVEEAKDTVEGMLSGTSFGSAGKEVVIEEFLEGEELSFFALCDGQDIVPFGTAQDHKRAYDGDKGPNTGGMGCYSPANLDSPELNQKIMDRCITPLVKGMHADGMPFMGVLFAGIMVKNGEPTIIEYNIRFGDPECQALMLRFGSDFLSLIDACAEGRLADVKDDIYWREPAVCVVMAAEGYPGSYKKNTVINNLKAASILPETKIFHAGTALDNDGNIVSIGGRVLGVTTHAPTIKEARDKAYRAVDTIDWPDGFCRRDIAWRALSGDQKDEVA